MQLLPSRVVVYRESTVPAASTMTSANRIGPTTPKVGDSNPPPATTHRICRSGPVRSHRPFQFGPSCADVTSVGSANELSVPLASR